MPHLLQGLPLWTTSAGHADARKWMAIPLRGGPIEKKSLSIFSRQNGQRCRTEDKGALAGGGAKEISGG
jgi:hypothetical protein